MSDLDQISTTLECLYESVIEPKKWPQALEAIAHCVGGHAAGDVSADPSRGFILNCETVNIAPEFKHAYLNHVASLHLSIDQHTLA